MSEQTPQPIPVSWVSREDLLYSNPEMRAQIEALDEGDLHIIADKLGDSLQDTYWLALGIILVDYFKSEKDMP